MASEDDILFSDLASSHPLTLNGNDTIIPIAHPDSGSDTGYANMSTTPNQMGAYAVQSQTHANLKTSSKTVESSINQIVSNLAPDFSTSETYAVDDIVLYEGNIYKCITAVETAGAWDSTKWTQIKVTDLESGGCDGHDYSTTEQVVGTWIDGSTLYEKSYTVAQLPAVEDNVDIPYNITNLGEVVNLTGIMINSTSHMSIQLPYNADYEYGVQFVAYETYIRISVHTNRSAWKAIVTIRYTKASV